MSWYREYGNEWKEIIEAVARECKRAELMVEKDTVQSVERTFIDKIFAICDYRIQNMQDRDSRHLYDICKLLPVIKMDLKLDELIDTVRNDRMHSKNNPSAQLEYNIPEMLTEIISSRFYKPDYRNVTKKLLYEDIGYDYAIENGIAVVAESDVFLYKKKIFENSRKVKKTLAICKILW